MDDAGPEWQVLFCGVMGHSYSERFWREPPVWIWVLIPAQGVGLLFHASAPFDLCGSSSGHTYGETVGSAVGTQLQLTDALYETGVRSTDPAALKLAKSARLPASPPFNTSLYFSHESGYVLIHWFLCGPV